MTTQHWLLAVTSASLALGAGCSSGDSLPPPVSMHISAAEGGTIALRDGTELVIPALALREDTTVTVSPVGVGDDAGLAIGALKFGPPGLILAKPAIARFPLPESWEAEQVPLAYESWSDNPDDSLPNGEMATLSVQDGAYLAEVNVYHFSCSVISRNCHAGTIKHVLQSFEIRGCNRNKLVDDLNERHQGVGFGEESCASAGPAQVQSLLDTYFEDVGGWDPGQPVPADVLSEAVQAARDGRQVVLAFSQQPWGARGGKHGFYPSGPYAHTATLRVEQGQVVIHNTVMTNNTKLRKHFGGEVTATWPADKLEEFRKLQTGVALEIQICGEPGCLTSADKNPYGLEVYPPLNGIDWTHKDCWLSLGNACRPPRPVAWPAVRIYVEKAAADQNPCEHQVAELSLSAAIDIPGWYSQTYLPTMKIAGLGQVTDGQDTVLLGKIPTISGSQGSLALPTANLSIGLHPSLPGPGTYSSFGELQEGAQIMILFFTDTIRDDGPLGQPVVFEAVSGSVTVNRFGATLGSMIKGSFDVTIQATRDVCNDGSCQETHDQIITGTMTGGFEGELTLEQ